jgi:hypothetical protein
MKQAMMGVIGLGVMAGCAGPRMVPPGEVAKGSQVLEVADRSSMTGALANESFKLGSFEVVDVDRDWNKSSGFGVGGYSKESTTTGYSYGLKGGGAAWTGACASKADSQGVAVLGGQAAWGKTSITCECKNAGTTVSVVLKNESPNSSHGMSGELTTGGAKYKVSEVTETDKSNFTSGPAGFRFDGDAGSVGAVEVLRPGRVWLNERLPEAERTPVACLSAGLMLYQPPSDH